MNEMKQDIKMFGAFALLIMLLSSCMQVKTLQVGATLHAGGFESGIQTFVCEQSRNNNIDKQTTESPVINQNDVVDRNRAVESGRECEQYVRPSAARWNGITNNVSLAYDSYKYPAEYEGATRISRATISIYENATQSDPTMLGLAQGKKDCGIGGKCEQVNIATDTATKMVIYIYKANVIRHANDYQANPLLALHTTVTHEVGHALSLAHPELNENREKPDSIMNTYPENQEIENYAIRNYDKEDLKKKWDN